MPRLIIVELARTAWWQIHIDSPAVFPLQRWPGVRLICPLAWPSVVTLRKDLRYGVHGCPPDAERSLVVASNFIALIWDGLADLSEEQRAVFETNFFLDHIPELLRQLRWAGCSPIFPTRHKGGTISDLVGENLIEIRVPERASGAAVSGVDRYWLVSCAAIRDAASRPEGWEPPVYGWLLLDAIDAWQSHDYKKSVLLAAISAETVASLTLEQRFQTLSKQPETPQLRLVEGADRGANAKKTDPVYEELVTYRRGGRIQRLLHEASLYVLGRSLKVDDRQLFEEIDSIFKSRNEIVHKGGSKFDQGGFFVHHRAVEANLDSVIRLHRWFAAPGEYSLVSVPLHLNHWKRSEI